MMTIAELFHAIGEIPVLVALLFILGIPFVLWLERDLIKRVLFGRPKG